jgi:RNA polymerase sigma-70 factor (ECF subfamily)
LFRLWAKGAPSGEVANEANRVESDEQSLLVRQGVQKLPSASREVVVLHYLQQLPVAEVAEVLGISPGAVSTRLTRARQQLAKVLPADLVESRAE